VLCRGCNKPIATWAVFKQRTTEAILTEIGEAGAPLDAVSYDPLDAALVETYTHPRADATKLG